MLWASSHLCPSPKSLPHFSSEVDPECFNPMRSKPECLQWGSFVTKLHKNPFNFQSCVAVLQWTDDTYVSFHEALTHLWPPPKKCIFARCKLFLSSAEETHLLLFWCEGKKCWKDKKGNTGARKKGSCCYLYMALAPPHTPSSLVWSSFKRCKQFYAEAGS